MSLFAGLRGVNLKKMFVRGLIVQPIIADRQIIFMGSIIFLCKRA